MKPIIPARGENLLELGKRCNAVYICPKINGRRKGPLVVYAGKDEKARNLVGDIYFNFRRIEVHPRVVQVFAEAAYSKLHTMGLIDKFDTVCGIPNGGRTFGQMLAYVAMKRFAYVDRIPKPMEVGKKQEYTWDPSQFEFEEGERLAVVEDVFNNFNNTDGTLEAVGSTGAKITLLVGALNRSPIYNTSYTPKSGPFAGNALPVVASIREVYPEYRQIDPEVLADMEAGNIEWEVKKNWGRLMAIMASNS